MKQVHCKSKRQSYEKKRLYLVIRRRMAEKKVFVMKWTVLLVLLGMLQVSAKVHSQHVAIDLKMENSTIEQVLQRITDQTCLNFF